MNRWKVYKITYNVSQFLIGITLAEIAFSILGGWGQGPTDPVLWASVLAAMYITFAVNTTAIMLVVSMVEGTRFLDLFRLPLSMNVVHWVGNMALGILGAIFWTAEPIALVLMIAPVGLTFTTYRRWVQSIRERDQMRDLYEAGRALSGPLASAEDFGGFLGLLEKLLAADRVELVVVEGSNVAVHASAGVRYLTVDEAETAPLEAFVAVHSGVAPQIALVGDEGDVRGVLAVYRPQVLTAPERLLLDGLANQIAARLQDHRLFGKTLERARLSEIVSHTSDGVFTVDTLGRIATWNPAMQALTGYTEVEALGRPCHDLLGLARDTVFSDGAAGDGEARDTEIRTCDGTKKDVRLRTSVIRDDEEAPPARIVVVRDASEETRAEQIKRDFVSMVSHELRTPLTPLKGFLMSLVEGTVEDSPERREEYYRIMLRQAQRLERTVSDMLDVSHDRGRRSGHRSPTGASGPRAGTPGERVPGAAPRASRRRWGDRAAGDRPRRPVPGGAGRVEPALECGQIHGSGATDHGRRHQERPPRHDLRLGQGRGHRTGAPRSDLRPLLPGEGRVRLAAAGDGARPLHRSNAGRGDVGEHLGRVRGRRRHDVLVQPPDHRSRPARRGDRGRSRRPRVGRAATGQALSSSSLVRSTNRILSLERRAARGNPGRSETAGGRSD